MTIKNPLLQLAWSGMSEKAIVRKLAAKCRDKGLRWERGDITEIREIVKNSYPPRGQKKKRTDLVAEEIERQTVIANKRRSLKPKPFEVGTFSDRLRYITKTLLGGSTVGRPISIRHDRGSTIILFNHYTGSRLVILRPRPHVGPQNKLLVRLPRVTRDCPHIVEALIASSWSGWSGDVRKALLDGRRVDFDFQELETRVHHGSRVNTYKWTWEPYNPRQASRYTW